MNYFKTPVSNHHATTLIAVAGRLVAKSGLIFFALLLTAQVVLAANRTWTGTVNTAWNNSSNWSPAFVPVAGDLVSIPAVANMPVVSAGVSAKAAEVKILANATFTVDQGGSLTIDNSPNNGMINEGYLYNSGLIVIGTTVGIPNIGLENKGNFENKQTGEMQINNCGNIGVFLNDGTLINKGKLKIGNTAPMAHYGIASSLGHFTNAAGALITTDRTPNAGLFLTLTSFQNYGKINVGNDAGTSVYGMEVYGDWFNGSTGEITINRCSQTAFRLTGQTFENRGSMLIGQIANAGMRGIDMSGELLNNEGTIKIDRTTNEAIQMDEFASLTNRADITIGAIASVGSEGIDNVKGDITNELTGVIKIDRATASGIHCEGDTEGSFLNRGTVNIGSIASSMNYGFDTDCQFLNEDTGVFTVDRSSLYGIRVLTNSYVFWNRGTINIGSIAASGLSGFFNNGQFENSQGALIKVNRVAESGIQNVAYFGNFGAIKIGDLAPTGIYSIDNRPTGTFHNAATGNTQLNGASDGGIRNSKRFINEGYLIIGNISSPGFFGLNNEGLFENHSNGLLYISRSSVQFIVNSGTLENSGKIAAGDTGPDVPQGILNSSTGKIINLQSGDIKINLVSAFAFINAGTFENHHFVNIVTGTHSIINTGTIENFDCSDIVLSGIIVNSGDFIQDGRMAVNTSQAHTNNPAAPKSFTNKGIIQYPQGSPVPNVINAGVIITPASGECNMLNSVLANANPALHTIGTTWYQDLGLTIPGGTYNPATNTFVPTVIATKFYFNVHNNISACDKLASITTSYGDVVAPTVVCKNYSVNLDANGWATVTPANVMQSASDNCSAVTPQTVTPSVLNCSHIGTTTVVLKVADATGNTSTCAATVTVKDVTAPTVVCNAYTAPLDASGNATVSPANVFKSGTDNCSMVNQLFVTPSGFTCNNLGNHTVTLTVDDSHGNTATCQATVTVVDNTAPTMICKPVSVALNAAGQAFIDVAQVNNGSFDNCALVSMNLSQSVFTCANVGANSIKLFGTDPSNNQGQCTATVMVTDPIKPTAVCKNATVNLGVSGSITVPASAVNNGSTDNCTFIMSVAPYGFNCSNIGQNTVTLKVTDAVGNTSTCTAKVTIKDATAPTALCKNPTVYLDAVGHASLTVAQVDNGSTDACGIATMSLSKTQFNCSELAGSPWTVTLNMTDVNGNTSNCLATVTVRDNIAPTAMCENITVALGSNGKVTVTGAEVAGDASFDNCSVWTYNPTAKVYTTANIGNNNLTVTVKDYSGNAATCIGVVTVTPYQNFGAGAEERGTSTQVENEDLMVYPNPAMNFATMEFELPQDQQYEVRMIDMTGRVVMQLQENGFEGRNALPLDFKGIASGVYVIEFQSGMLKGQQRLVVQNN